MELKHRLFCAGFAALAATGADRGFRALARGRGVILMLHRVRPRESGEFAPNDVLEITPEFLDVLLTELRREGFEIVPLDAVPDRLWAGSAGRPFAALTFDDGYRDNLEFAWPILKRHRAPWTLFITTDFADGRGQLWWVELELAIARLERVEIPSRGGMLEVSSRTTAEKQAAFDAIYRDLRAGPEDRLRAVIADLARQAGVDTARIAPELCLGWAEIEALAREPEVSIGSHTLSHPILAKCDAAKARREIAESKVVLQRRLGRPVRHLAYPFGDPTAVGLREIRFAQEAGYATATISSPGHVFPEHAEHLCALPRVSVNGLFQNKTAVRVLLSGVPFLVWNRKRTVTVAG